MKTKFASFKRSASVFSILIVMILGLSNSGLHPTTGNGGYTGAPGDSACNQCHGGGGSLNGDVIISGLPPTIETNQTYTIEVTVNNPNGNAVRAGFQLVALNGSNGNAGSMSSPSPNTQLRTAGGKTYFGHSPAQNFAGSNSLTFTVNWTAPSSTGSIPEIKFYASSVIANGNGNTSGDLVVLTSEIIPISSPSDPLSIDIIASNDPLCFEGNDGSATAEAMGGSGGYSYLWDDGTTNSTNSNLSAGTHSVTVTDSDGNTASTSVNLNDPPELVISITGSTICDGASNGTVTTSVNGGTGGYLYSWNTGATTPNLSNLPAGLYVVTITDSNGCEAVNETVVFVSPTPEIDFEINHPTCHDASDGSLYVVLSNGNFPVTFSWSTGSTSENINGLAEGTYSVTITDAANCEFIATQTLIGPEPINAVITTTDASCSTIADGEINVGVSGGTAPYTVFFSNGTQSIFNPAIFSNIYPDNYTIYITDFNDCDILYNVEISASADIIANAEIQDASCFGLNDGSITLTPENILGNAIYNWSTGHNISSIDSLVQGTYQVTITDDSTSCQKIFEFTILEPEKINSLIIESREVLCSNDSTGFLTVSLSGGTGNLSFEWSNGSRDTSIINLPIGEYNLDIIDESNCNESYTYSVTLADSISIDTIIIDKVLCNGDNNGGILVVYSGGFGDLNISWADTLLTGDTLTQLLAGIYPFTIIDDAQCRLQDTILMGEPDILSSIEVITNTSDTDIDDGKIDIIPQGGTSPYSIIWNDLNTEFNRQNLSSGFYEYVISDANECTFGKIVIVESSNCLLNIDIQTNFATCYDSFDGSIILNITGNSGEVEIKILKENQLYLGELDSLGKGIYTIIVEDTLGCVSFISNITIESLSDELVVNNVSINPPTNENAKDGFIALSLNNNVADLQFTWFKNGDFYESTSDPILLNVSIGVYSVEITDKNGCSTFITNIVIDGTSNVLYYKVSEIIIYPNPTKNHIKISGVKNEWIDKIDVLDSQGKIVNSIDIPLNQQTFEINELGINTPGLYFFKFLMKDNEIVFKKVVISP